MGDDEETDKPEGVTGWPSTLERIALRDPTITVHISSTGKGTRRCFFCQAQVAEYRDQRNLPIIALASTSIPLIDAVVHLAGCLWQQARSDLGLTDEMVGESSIHHFVAKPT